MAKNIQEFVSEQVSNFVQQESFWTSQIEPRSCLVIDGIHIIRIPDKNSEERKFNKTNVRFITVSNIVWHPAIDLESGGIVGGSVSDVIRKIKDIDYAAKNNPKNLKAAEQYLNNKTEYFKVKNEFKDTTNPIHQTVIDHVMCYSMNGAEWKYG